MYNIIVINIMNNIFALFLSILNVFVCCYSCLQSVTVVTRYHFNSDELILIIVKEDSKGESSENLIDGC